MQSGKLIAELIAELTAFKVCGMAAYTLRRPKPLGYGNEAECNGYVPF